MDVWDPEDEPFDLQPFGCYGGDVYYDPRSNSFFQLRNLRDDYMIISDFCKYYCDAKTTTGSQMMPVEYLRECEKVKNLDDCNYAKYDKFGKAFKTKERKQLKSGSEPIK